MKIDNSGGTWAARMAQQAYAAQESQATNMRCCETGAQSAVAQQRRDPSGFSFSLGKLTVSYEVEKPAVDSTQLALTALTLYERQQQTAFRTELEIATLRQDMVQLEKNEAPALLPAASASKQQTAAAAKAYAAHQRAYENNRFRPGVTIGVG